MFFDIAPIYRTVFVVSEETMKIAQKAQTRSRLEFLKKQKELLDIEIESLDKALAA